MQGFFLENTELNLISKTPFTVIPRLKDIEKRLASDINNKKNYNKTWPALANLSKYNEIQNPDNYYLDNVQTFGESAYQLINFEAIRTPFFVMDSVLLLVNYFQNIIERYQFNGTYLY